MRILLIATQYPWPVEKGGASQRTRFLLDALRVFGEVDVLVAQNAYGFDHFDVPQEARKIEGVAIHERVLPYQSNFNPDRAWIQNFVREGRYDLIAIRYLRGAARSGALFITSVPLLLDIDDVDWLVVRTNNAQIPKNEILRRAFGYVYERFMEYMARKYLKRFAHVWTANADDEPELRSPHSSTLPNIPVLPEGLAPKPSQADATGSTIFFVGTLGYPPNSQGLTRFLDNVWPRVLAECPNARVRIAGRLPIDQDDLVDQWRRQPNTDVLGPLDSLDEEYERAAFTVAPVYWGGGTKIKVLESLGRGRTCVCAPHALSGLSKQALHLDSLWHAESDEAFAEGCIALFKDPDLRHRLENRGREVIQAHYSIESFNRVVGDAVQRVVGHAR